uniref:Uncharacterized protein n=1 Tax=Rhizophora mucronata TaxID=61149 RepID=A0A2P2PTH5_RHIMU
MQLNVQQDASFSSCHLTKSERLKSAFLSLFPFRVVNVHTTLNQCVTDQ